MLIKELFYLCKYEESITGSGLKGFSCFSIQLGYSQFFYGIIGRKLILMVPSITSGLRPIERRMRLFPCFWNDRQNQ